jgi:putative two-component system response regulator
MDLFLPVKPTLLLVDDSPENLTLLAGLVHGVYTAMAVTRGAKALEVARQAQPDLILLDILMPGVNGYEVCRQLKCDPQTRNIPVIFLTSKSDIDSEEIGMEIGAVDFISRPISPQILLSRIKAHIAESSRAQTMRVNNAYLEFAVGRRTQELVALQKVTVLAMATLAEVRDQDTGNHLRRTQNYVKALANQLRHQPRFSSNLTAKVIEMLFECAPLHDIGKVGIPDRILLKAGRFELDEFAIMKTHPTLGYEALLVSQDLAKTPMEFLEIAKQIVYSHHEKWDGSGYPQGLVGDAIPIPARLMALADVYDALISKRVYKAGMNHEEAVQIIVAGRGTHFDPDVVDAFVELEVEFDEISKRFADSEDDLKKKASQIDLMNGVKRTKFDN